MQPGIFNFEPLSLGVIVTAVGTGSESNGRAIITNEKLKIKTGRDYPQCNPKFALLDPTYTYNINKKQIVSSDIAEALMCNVIKNLRAIINNSKDYVARSNLMWDAAMAENRIIRLGK